MTVISPEGTEIPVIDTQVHLNFLGTEPGLAAMNAIGVDVVIYDEWWTWDAEGERLPSYKLGGYVEHEYPRSLDAAMTHPSRFASMGWLDRRHPDIRPAVARIAANPFQPCIRVPIRGGTPEQDALAAGGYEELFAVAGEYGVPLMVCLPRVPFAERFDLIAPVIDANPATTVILDHCGVLPLSTAEFDQGMATVERVAETLRYSVFDSVHVKWSWAPLLSRQQYPWLDVQHALRDTLDAFGSERVMWASDTTQTAWHHSWAQSIYYLLHSELLADREKHDVLGATAARVLGIHASPRIAG